MNMYSKGACAFLFPFMTSIAWRSTTTRATTLGLPTLIYIYICVCVCVCSFSILFYCSFYSGQQSSTEGLQQHNYAAATNGYSISGSLMFKLQLIGKHASGDRINWTEMMCIGERAPLYPMWAHETPDFFGCTGYNLLANFRASLPDIRRKLGKCIVSM